MVLFRLQHRPNANADRKHADDGPVSGAHAEENCTAAEEAGLPSASTASATWLASIGKCDAALRFPLWLGHQVVEHVNERWLAWIRRRRKPRAARRAMKRATIDETSELSSARRAGATECGPAPEALI